MGKFLRISGIVCKKNKTKQSKIKNTRQKLKILALYFVMFNVILKGTWASQQLKVNI